jgi:hypothetical protein
VRDDVDTSLLEVGNFVLTLADDDFNQRLGHPVALASGNDRFESSVGASAAA